MNQRLLLIGIFVLSLGTLGKGSAEASTIVLYQADFEPPTFVPGLLQGQDGWSAFADSVDAATVSTDLPRSGVQSLKIDWASLNFSPDIGGSFGLYGRILPYDPLGSGTPLIEVSADINVPVSAAACAIAIILGDASFAAFAGINLEIDNGHIVLINDDIVSVERPGYTFGEWAHLQALFDFQNRTVGGFFNGEFFGEIPFTSGIGDTIGAIAIAAGGPFPPPELVAHVDNVAITATTVPEPTTGILLSTGILAVGAVSVRRRRFPA